MVSSVCFKTRIGDVKDKPLKIYPLDVHLKKKTFVCDLVF